MRMINSEPAAWICTVAGLILHAAILGRRLRPGIRRRWWTLLLPALLCLLCAKTGFLALQENREYAQFRWCFSTGLAGLAAGTALAARLNGRKAADILDGTSAAACLAMAFGRLAQRWMGETGIGPILEIGGPLTMMNDWDESVLAVWMIETGICLLAAGLTAALSRRSPRRSGGTTCLAVGFLMIPQILAEQFRSGEYLRFMMMRLEQVLFALAVLGTLLWMCAGFRKAVPGGSTGAAWAPCICFLTLTALIAAVQFTLDGKLFAWPEAVCWILYTLALGGMLGTEIYAVRRLDRA